MEYTEKQMISFFKKNGYSIKELENTVELYLGNVFIINARDIETIFKNHPLSPLMKK